MTYVVCSICGLYQDTDTAFLMSAILYQKDMKFKHGKIECNVQKDDDRLSMFKIFKDKDSFHEYMYEHYDKEGKWHVEVLSEDNRNDNIGKIIMVDKL